MNLKSVWAVIAGDLACNDLGHWSKNGNVAGALHGIKVNLRISRSPFHRQQCLNVAIRDAFNDERSRPD
jgi:hypothetical protein